MTSTTRDPTSSNIADYNSFVQAAAAAGHSAIRPYSARFRVVASTAAVDARDNTGTTGAGVPIHWLNSNKVADNYADFYDGSWDDISLGSDESGNANLNSFVWTGSNADGTKSEYPLGASTFSQFGRVGVNPLISSQSPNVISYPFYALSPVFEVGPPVVSLDLASGARVPEGVPAAFRLGLRPALPYAVHVAVLVREEGTAFDNGAPDPYPGHVLPRHRGEFVVEIPANASNAVHSVPTRSQSFLERDTTVHLLVMKPTAGVRSIARNLPASRGGGVELGSYVTDGANTATVTVLDGNDSPSAVTPEVRLYVHPEDTEVAEGRTIEFWLAMKPQPVSDLAVSIDVADGVKPNPGVQNCGSFLAPGAAGRRMVTVPGRGGALPRLGWHWVRFTAQTVDDETDERDCDVVATVAVPDGAGYRLLNAYQDKARVRVTDNDEAESSQDSEGHPKQDSEGESTQDSEVEDGRRVEEDVAAAVAFWQVRNNPAKLQYWLEIQSALETGEVLDDLMARVTVSWNGASPGGRFYATWEGVYNRFVALRAAADDDGQTRTQTDGATVFGGGSAMEAPDAAPRIPAGTTPAGLLSGPGSGVCVSARLRAEAAGRAGETWLGQAHVERWLRVLWTFSGGAGDATVVTPAEADFHAAAGGLAHWLPVADALRCLEARALEDALSR